MLTRGHDDPTAGSAVVLVGEDLYEQQGGSGIQVPVRVQLPGWTAGIFMLRTTRPIITTLCS